MRLGVHGRTLPATSAALVDDVLRRMERHGLRPVLQPSLVEWLETCGLPVRGDVGDAGDLSGIDMMISLGGDGSILDTLQLVGRCRIPILGINLGRLGYLSNIPFEGVDEALLDLKAGRYELEPRTLVEVAGLGSEVGDQNFALNEVSVHKRDSSSMITLHAYLGDRFLNTYWADGLIIATPTGSTAYSLSCGGPLLDPACADLVITPIAPHNLTVRPLVVPDHLDIRLVVETRGENFLVNMDARSVTLEHGSELTVRRAGFTAQLVQFRGQDFLDTLRTKLAWGLDARSQAPPVGRKT
jgi:NAD+ kinase